MVPVVGFVRQSNGSDSSLSFIGHVQPEGASSHWLPAIDQTKPEHNESLASIPLPPIGKSSDESKIHRCLRCGDQRTTNPSAKGWMVRCLHWLPSTSWARTATCTIETWRSITITAAFKPAEISPNQKDMYAYLHLNQTVRMKGKRINYKSESLTTNQNPQEGRLAKKSLKRPSCHPNWSGFPSLVNLITPLICCRTSV